MNMESRTQRLAGYADASRPLIYQMGKVGSSSIEHAIPGAFNVHTLYGNSTCPPHHSIRTNSLAKKLAYRLANAAKRRAIKSRDIVNIVTLVRHPIARNRSMFFQDLPFWLAGEAAIRPVDGKSEGIDRLVACYRDTYDHYYFDRWFDDELKRLTGIDIYSVPYDVHTPTILQKGRFRVFCTRVEDLAAHREQLDRFLGLEVRDVAANVGERKWYAAAYRQFRETVATMDIEHALLETRTARHFGYSQAE